MQRLFVLLVATLMATGTVSGSALALDNTETAAATIYTQDNNFVNSLPLAEGPVQVTVSFELRDIDHFDDEAETIEFTAVMKLSWHDARQAFDPLVDGTDEKIYQGNFLNPCYAMLLVTSLQGWKQGAYFGAQFEVSLFN